MKNRSIKILLTLSALSIMPYFAFANGGDQRVVENQYLINLSRAPFTPRVGVKTSFLASFVDIQKSKLISEDLIVRVRISKLADAAKTIELLKALIRAYTEIRYSPFASVPLEVALIEHLRS